VRPALAPRLIGGPAALEAVRNDEDKGAPSRPDSPAVRLSRVSGETAGSVRLAELLGALSLAADLGAGQPPEHSLRTCVLASRLALGAGLGEDDVRDVFHVSLLRSIGCTSDAHEQAALFGDELAARAELNLAAHLSPRELVAALSRHVGSDAPPVTRARFLGRTLAEGRGLSRRVAATHCDAAERLARRLGIEGSARAALAFVFETTSATRSSRPSRGTTRSSSRRARPFSTASGSTTPAARAASSPTRSRRGSSATRGLSPSSPRRRGGASGSTPTRSAAPAISTISAARRSRARSGTAPARSAAPTGTRCASTRCTSSASSRGRRRSRRSAASPARTTSGSTAAATTAAPRPRSSRPRRASSRPPTRTRR
jgi:hypothetical protein